MRELLETAREAILDGEIVILCTVVRLEGSGYGRPGARMILTESGERVGYISGGCLEKDLRRRVWAETESGPKFLAFDTRGNSVSSQSAYNTGCEGVVYVLAQRVASVKNPAIEIPLRCLNENRPIVTATVYRSSNPLISVGQLMAYQDESSTKIYSELEEIQYSLSVLLDDSWTAQKSSTAHIRLENGEIEIALEFLKPQPRLIIFGVGDDVVPVSNLAVSLDWNVTVIGDRPELAHKSRFPKATVHCGSFSSFASEFSFHPDDEILLLTHNIQADAEVLPILLSRGCHSIGLLGSRRRWAKLLSHFHEHGITLTDDDIAMIHTPVGLDIGAETPQEIAVSIVSEIMARRSKKSKAALSTSERPMHDRERRHQLDGSRHRRSQAALLTESAQ